MTQNAATPHARLVVSSGLLLKAAHHHAGMYQHGAGYYLLNGRWHKLHKDKPAPKGAPVAAHPKAGGDHQAVAHFTQEQWDALKLPDTNTNAPSYNKALANLQQLSDAGDVTGMLAISYGSNTYGQKLAKIANHLLGLHGSQHKVAPGQKAGTHAALQSAPATPNPTGLPEHLAPKTTPDLQEPGPLAPLAQHVKDTLDEKAAEGNVDFLKMVAANNPEHPQIVAYAQQKLAELDGKAHKPAPVESPAPPAPSGPLAMPAFDEGKTTTGVVDYYKKVAQKIIDHGHAGNASVLADMKEDGLKPNAKGKTTNTWLGKTANSKKLLALHAAALEHATGGKPAAEPSNPHDTESTKVLHVIPSDDPQADYNVLIGTPKSAPGSKFSVIMKDGGTGEALPVIKVFDKESDALDHAHALAAGKNPAAPASQPKPEPDAVPAPAAAPAVTPETGKITAQQLSNLQSIPWFKLKLPPENTNAKSHNAALAKIEAMAFAGDTDGLQAFIDAKAGAKQTYAKKQVLTAQTALAGLGTPGATAAVPVQPAPAAAKQAPLVELLASASGAEQKLAVQKQFLAAHGESARTFQQLSDAFEKDGDSATAQYWANKADEAASEQMDAAPVAPAPAKPSDPLLSGVSADTAIASFKAASPNASLADFEAKWKEANAGKVGLNAEWAMAANPAPAAAPPAAPKAATAPKTILHNTTPGHSKSWSVYVAPNASGGFDMVTEYGKIGAKQQKTAKTFPTADAAHNAAAALKQEKFGKGYVTQKVDYGHQVTVAGGDDTGPKEGDTKQGADGMLVLKDGHWVKMGGTPAAIKKLDLLKVNLVLQTLPQQLSPQPKFSSNAPSKMALAAASAGDAAGMAAAYSKAFDLGYEKTGGHIKAVAEAMGVDTSKWGSGSVATSAAAPAPAAKPAANNLPSMDSWIQTGPQGGSNPGGRFKDADGVEWYCKFPPDEGHARSEVLAAKLYEAAGLKSQDAKLVTKGGKVGIASRWVDVKKVGAEGLKDTPGALGGFVVDAWLANWDVVGMGYDNLQVGSDGRAVRVDAGGSLQYRAQGAAKPFGHKVEEIKTMRDPKKNPQAAAVFGALTAADMTASAKKVLSISDDQIHDLVMAHGPGDVSKKAELIDALIARKEDIAKQFPKAVPKEKVKPKPDPTKLKVSADQLPKPHDFKNWKGAGNGLSSKTHVNEANQAAEQALLDTALKGNLIALKDYHFDALDKETGAVVGKKPISEHPSNHVKTYWSDLVSTLSFIAYPPEALKKFKSVVATSITKVSDAFKAAKYGTTTKGVEANSRLAFWIALGNTKPAESLLPPGASLDFQSSPTGQPKVTSAMTEQAKAAYQALNSGRPVKRFINGIQSSGSYNDNFRDGRMVTTDGWDAAAMALDAYGYATEKPEGFELYKWISFPGDMGKQMLSAPPGTVFQNPGSMCCSTGPTGTAGFGADRVRIRYAKGAKAVDSFGSGNFPGEKEITTLPGQRFVILKCHKVMCPVKGKERIELDVLMLPPDPTYVAELEAMKGKHGGKS